MGRRVLVWSVLAVLGLAVAPDISAAKPAARTVASTYGSGNFGTWMTDRWGLPAYAYSIDQNTNPIAAQPALGGSRDAWNAVANGHDKVDAHVDGRMQFWSQDHLAEWANDDQPAARHHSGGWGYLRVGGRTIATDYNDLPPGVSQRRRFGMGYFQRQTDAAPVAIDEYVYVPFGDDPLVLHDVTLRNRTRRTITATWWEYWDVNPVALGTTGGIAAVGQHNVHLGLGRVRYDAATGTLSAAQNAGALDHRPLSIFASALGTPVAGYVTTTGAFFGHGTRADPAAVRTGSAGDRLAAASRYGTTGTTLFAYKTRVRLRPGATTTLHYAYGMARPAQIPALIKRYRRTHHALNRSMTAWRGYVPRATFGGADRWLSRELEWDTYLVKANERYEALCGTHVITQGNYYEYAGGFNAALRDPLEDQLGLELVDPEVAKQTLIWALQYQQRGTGDLPYGAASMCRRDTSLGTADDLNSWLILGVLQYVENTRDLSFLRQRVRYDGGGSGTVWSHLKLAYANQESRIGYGPHGFYRSGTEGDTFDLTTPAVGLRESISDAGNFAYVYPALAGLARTEGDHAFAARLTATARRLTSALRGAWQTRGWFARGYTTTGEIGVGTIYGDAQYWSLAAGVPTARQQAQLMANVKRYLDGYGAPSSLKGPSKIGPMELPAQSDPGISEKTAIWPGRQMWWFVDGPAVWAFEQRSDTLPGAAAYAWSIFRRLTLANHAATYPNDWSGVISTDDTCADFTGPNPGECGLAITGAAPLQEGYATQNSNPPAWVLFDFFKVAGIEADPRGFTIEPHLPMTRFTIRTRTLGVAYTPRSASGYVRPLSARPVRLTVALPRDVRAPRVRVDGRVVRAGRSRGLVTFTAHPAAGAAVKWNVSG